MAHRDDAADRDALRQALTDAIVLAIRSVVGDMPRPLVHFAPAKDFEPLSGTITMAEPRDWNRPEASSC